MKFFLSLQNNVRLEPFPFELLRVMNMKYVAASHGNMRALGSQIVRQNARCLRHYGFNVRLHNFGLMNGAWAHDHSIVRNTNTDVVPLATGFKISKCVGKEQQCDDMSLNIRCPYVEDIMTWHLCVADGIRGRDVNHVLINVLSWLLSNKFVQNNRRTGAHTHWILTLLHTWARR